MIFFTQTKPWRKVVKSTWGNMGVHNNERNPRAGTGRHWFLTLECGHEEIRAFRYFQCTGVTHFNLHDALPAPKRVRCSRCNSGGAA